MADDDNGSQKKNIRGTIGRRDVLKAGGFLSGAALLGGTGITRAFGASSDRTLTIGDIGWDENIALAYLSKNLLENELGYEVKVVKKGVDDLFSGVADGSIDTFQDVWLPRTHRSYWQQYGDKVDRLDPWFEGSATLGLTVPDYVQAQSIDDLAIYGNRFDHKIIGIEPGAGEMKIVRNEVMPGYDLGSYELTTGTTPKMLKQLEHALRRRKPIVVTLYKPHWAFSVYRIRYLDDPKGLISSHTERLYSIVRKGLKQDKPDAYAFLNAIRLNPNQLGRLELAVNNASSPEAGVRQWLKSDQAFGGSRGINRQLVQSWVDAAKRARTGS